MPWTLVGFSLYFAYWTIKYDIKEDYIAAKTAGTMATLL